MDSGFCGDIRKRDASIGALRIRERRKIKRKN
jgi:hypothetical protein